MQKGGERRLRKILDKVRALDGVFVLLQFIQDRPNTLTTVGDIASFLKQPYVTVEWALGALVDLGIARYTKVIGFGFYGLTVDPQRQQLARELCETLD